MTLQQYIQAAPKAELHVHLEGTIQPATMLALAQRNQVPLPVEDEEEMRKLFAYHDFEHFVEIFRMGIRCLRTSEDYEQMVYEYGAELARQHVRYAEITFSPCIHYSFGRAQDLFLSGLQRGRERVLADFGVQINWIFNLVRKWPDQEQTIRMADYATRVAVEYQDEGVVALGLAGIEAGAPPESFAPWFEQARVAGLHSVPHAGEFVGPQSIWGAIKALGAERIEHGVRAIEDPALVEYLAQERIPLDITPTSNICLGVYPNYAAHPLPRLYAASIPITISSDDPPLLNTSVNQDMLLLADSFGLDVTAIDEIILNGIRSSFLEESRRRELEATFRAELANLKRQFLASENEEA
jgi:aminodeoxyfutalosine deaminase